MPAPQTDAPQLTGSLYFPSNFAYSDDATDSGLSGYREEKAYPSVKGDRQGPPFESPEHLFAISCNVAMAAAKLKSSLSTGLRRGLKVKFRLPAVVRECVVPRGTPLSRAYKDDAAPRQAVPVLPGGPA